MPADHAGQALEVLLYGRPVPAIAMGAYFLRNYGFNRTDSVPVAADIILGFRQWFRFDDDDEFALLFELGEPAVAFQWFGPEVVEANK
ncbi:hypothetical protein C3E77_14250 [Mycetocola zhujimingii]|nr:hypothetical protein C3E77_14250 [Mycetocola zhujimingii]